MIETYKFNAVRGIKYPNSYSHIYRLLKYQLRIDIIQTLISICCCALESIISYILNLK